MEFYRRRGQPLFDLNQYYSAEDIVAGIDQLNYNYRSVYVCTINVQVTSVFPFYKTSLHVYTSKQLNC